MSFQQPSDGTAGDSTRFEGPEKIRHITQPDRLHSRKISSYL